MGKELFGTDGIRGVAGDYPLDPRTIHAFGNALGSDLVRRHGACEVVIGMDTRESGAWIAEQVAGGLAEKNVRSRLAGVIATPGIAYLTSNNPFAAGIMISASHNPYLDNGIKVFGHSGYKLPDDEEHEIEQEIFRVLERNVEPAARPLLANPELDAQYVDHLLSTMAAPLSGMKIVLDCGNGAAYKLAPELFRRAGAEVVAIHAEPNGRNINLNCGALHVEQCRDAVLAHSADCGVAFDGDADRAIFVSRSGKIIDGDAVLLICARALKAAGELPGDTVVSTVMSNLGFENALQRDGIRLLRAAVGDKYVLEEMQRTGAVIGGEQSGHVIFSRYATTGDGMLTALRVFEVSRQSGLGLDELTADFQVYPQKLLNVRVRERRKLDDMPSVTAEIRRGEAKFGGAGRILVRFSGTEPLARVMVEGADMRLVEEFTQRIAAAIQNEIGV